MYIPYSGKEITQVTFNFTTTTTTKKYPYCNWHTSKSCYR